MANKKEIVVERLKRNKIKVLSKSNNKKTYRGYMPHYNYEGLIQSITYRLEDAIPLNKINELRERHQNDSEYRVKIEDFLDKGHGSSILTCPEIAYMLIENWLHFHTKSYNIIAFIVMPNHVHILIEQNKDVALSKIIHSWKSYTSNQFSKLLPNLSTPPKWGIEYWDRYIRNKDHLHRAIEYILNNPVKAKLCKKQIDWPYSSLHFSQLIGKGQKST